MKTFIKRASIVAGVICAALLCMGIVYIDNTKHYFYQAGGLVQMWVNTNFVFNVDTNTGRVGWGATNTSVSFAVQGQRRATNATGNGTTALASGAVNLTAGQGGGTFETTSAAGGVGGALNLLSGDGGDVPLATTNATGGNGGQVNITSGTGGANAGGAATNATSGGSGGAFNLTSGFGGSPSTPSTNTVGGSGGTFSLISANGATPSAGWARKGGAGGSYIITGGNGGNSVRTNGGNGAPITITAGSAGSATTSGNAGQAGDASLLGGAGNTGAGGDTNSNGGRVHLVGGAPGSGAVAGDVVVGRTSGGTSRGGLMVGPLLGGAVSITNVLGASASLDFPSTAAAAFSDLPITVTGVVSNNCAISLSVPWECATNGGGYVTYNSNDTVYVRLFNHGAAAVDPPSGTFTVVAFRIR